MKTFRKTIVAGAAALVGASLFAGGAVYADGPQDQQGPRPRDSRGRDGRPGGPQGFSMHPSGPPMLGQNAAPGGPQQGQGFQFGPANPIPGRPVLPQGGQPFGQRIVRFDAMVAAIALQLDMDSGALEAQLRWGKRLRQIAKDHGVDDLNSLKPGLVITMRRNLQQQGATEEQINRMVTALERMDLNRFGGPPARRR